MKRAYVALSFLLLALVLIGCEESIEEGAGNGYIEVRIDPAEIDQSLFYYYQGRNTTDNTYFSSESRTGTAIYNNQGYFLSPLLNVGTWECNVYELTQSYANAEAPSPSIINRQSLGNPVIVVKNETTRITIELAP